MLDCVEPSDSERSEWPDATREYVETLEADARRLREIVLPIGDCGIAWEPCGASHTPEESREIEASQKAHDAAYDHAKDARAVAEVEAQAKREKRARKGSKR